MIKKKRIILTLTVEVKEKERIRSISKEKYFPYFSEQ
jgi:hypothetical protein